MLISVRIQENKKVVVNLREKLDQVTFKGLHNDFLPRSDAFNDLATAAAKLKVSIVYLAPPNQTDPHSVVWQDKGAAFPFVFADVKKFLPMWVTPGSLQHDEPDSDSEQTDAAKALCRTIIFFKIRH